MSLQQIGLQPYERSAGAGPIRRILSILKSPLVKFGQVSRERAIKGLSVLTLLGIWYLGAAMLPSSVMPAPHLVFQVLWSEIFSGPIWSDVAITLTRIVLAFSVAVSVAVVLGFAMGLSAA